MFPEDGYVSGLHCRVHSEVGHVFVTDVGSSNGTFVNGSRIEESTAIMPGDVVVFGDAAFTYRPV